MDILTQGLLGAAVAQSGAPRAEIKKALVIGFLSGLLADADVFIQSANNALLSLEYHRHFTHALIFIPIGALIAALLLWPFYKKTTAFRVVYKYAFLGYLLSGVLDAMTSYGTHLYLPFSTEQVALHLIAIVDPVFTLALLTGIIFATRTGQKRYVHYALGACLVYLGISYMQLQRVEHEITRIASQRGHEMKSLVVKPTMGNIVLWRATYLNNDDIVIDALHAGFTGITHYPGTTVKRITPAMMTAIVPQGSVAHEDIKLFSNLSDGFIAGHPEKSDVVGDVRYALMPDSASPLWGIRVDGNQPARHVDFVAFRKADMHDLSRFFCMVQGRRDCRRPSGSIDK